ncbi:uncharacterized protein LOC121295277 isoform X2 [Polyodon spathula]|uniref:uncharacterized protein LOC121295277 isoform X2 n=1 Tax=Polyodon spathula TaxID=7913 RepID=UPI001B7E0F1C|nr:uncharacterized protein LOC121295277 isoform X2 [Polyodon spathula]
MCEQKDLVFESFLKKRKDRMKLTWATYWFRLQKTTLLFYTKKKLDASHLRGQYYIHTSAETEELRALWMKFLWKAMQLPGPGRTQSACTWHDIPHLKQEAAQSTQSSSDEDRLSSASCSLDTPEPLAPSGSSPATAEEGRLSTELEQLDFYDVPLSNKAVDDEDRSTANRMDTESIYNVPKSLLVPSTEEGSSTNTPHSEAQTNEPPYDDDGIYDIPTSLSIDLTSDQPFTGTQSAVEGMQLLDEIKSSLTLSSAGWLHE